jgi:hydroxyethylthiazole kinase-like sugar kinase family protein
MSTTFATIAAFAVIPHGGPAIAIVVGCILSAVIAAIVAMENDRAAFIWAAAAFIVALVVSSGAVDLLTG